MFAVIEVPVWYQPISSVGGARWQSTFFVIKLHCCYSE